MQSPSVQSKQPNPWIMQLMQSMRSHDVNAIHAIMQYIATAVRKSHARSMQTPKLVFAWSA
eukprot:7063723-Lingulodinium_polyedra.AAC.1